MSQRPRLATLSILALLAGCSTDSGGPLQPEPGSGGTAGAGGSTPTAGQPSTGGASGAAGVAAMGGTTAPGGSAGNAGSTSSGGANTGGAGAGGAGTSGAGTSGAGTSGAATGGIAGAGGAQAGSSGTGGAAGASGAAGSAGTSGAGTSGGGTGGTAAVGDISVTDPVPGFASVAGGTTGGGTNLATAISVNSMGALQNAAQGSNAALILVEPGTYNGTLNLGSNKTIIGIEPGVTITGNISISGDDAFNVIIRNVAVRGPRCNSYDECRAGSDAVYIGNGAHHVWLDHMDIADGQDGNCDVSQGGDYVTVSWSHFHYTYDKEHRFSNLIAGSDDEPASVGKLRITYMNSHWGERVDSRQPRGRFGNVHMLNNYHDTGGSQIHGVGVDMALIAENCVYDENISIWTDMGSPRGWRGIGNQGSASNLNASQGSVFEIPYDYTPLPASEVVAAVTASDCGAGNTCTLAR